MNHASQNRIYSLFQRVYASLNDHLGLEEDDIADIGHHAATPACEAFKTLDDLLEAERVRQGGRVRLLSLRPPGEVSLPIAQGVWHDVLDALVTNALAAGANSICFSTYLNDGYLWIAVTDNGWGFPKSVREQIRRGERLGTGLSFAYDTLNALGGGLRIGSPRTGAEIILRVPVQLT